MTPQLPPPPPIPDQLRHFMANKTSTGTLPLDRQAMFLATLVSNLTQQLDRKGFQTHVETRPSGFTLHVDIANHPAATTTELDDVSFG